MRKRGGLGDTSRALLAQVDSVLNELSEFWPLTLRQLYYQYKRLSELLTKARLAGLVPWEAIEDRSRVRLPSAGFADWRKFAKYELDDFLQGYRRDLLQGQKIALELWIEKDALRMKVK